MICPVCRIRMAARDVGGVMIDVCEAGCHGIWFDWNELARLDEPDEGLGLALDALLQSPPSSAPRERLRCSRCDIPMREHRYGSASRVLIDECYECRGFFLDPGELAAIRLEIARKWRVASILEQDPVWQDHLRDLAAEREHRAAIEKICAKLMQRVRFLGFDDEEPGR